MTRYQVLRHGLGLDPLAASLVAFLNWMQGVPEGYAGVMHTVIEYDPKEEFDKDKDKEYFVESMNGTNT